MNAGRELDALVEARVMGITWDETRRCRVCGWPLHSGAAPLSFRGHDELPDVVGCLPGNCSLRPAPERRADEPAPYSTDIAAAWLVVEAMRALDYELDLHHNHRNHLGKPNPAWTKTHAIFRGGWRGNRKMRDGGGISAEPAHAICLAALNAVGEQP